jgi:hypothetical protein
MNRINYFKSLVSLYESQKLTEADSDQIAAQEADEGTDVEQTQEPGLALPDQQAGIETAQQLPPAGLEDAGYLQDGTASGLPDALGVEPGVAESQRLAKLFELYKKLLEYTENFYDSLENIDIDLLDEKEGKEIARNREKLFSLMEKQKSYMTDVFTKEDKYEKSLYVYVLMRTELTAIIASVRSNMGLDQRNDSPADEIGENLKK